MKKGELNMVQYSDQYFNTKVSTDDKEFIELFLGGNVVIVSEVVGLMGDLSEIIARFQEEGKTFAIVGLSSTEYVLVREIESDSFSISPITNARIVCSDYFDIYGNARNIVSDIPESTLVKFYLSGVEVYFDVNFCLGG